MAAGMRPQEVEAGWMGHVVRMGNKVRASARRPLEAAHKGTPALRRAPPCCGWPPSQDAATQALRLLGFERWLVVWSRISSGIGQWHDSLLCTS